MRVALVLAPWAAAPHEGPDGGPEGLVWLRGRIEGMGFQVSVLGVEATADGSIARAIEGLTAEDTLLVHVSGRLARRGVLRAAGGQWMPLRTVGEALAGLAADVTVLVELVQEQDAEDALGAADHVASAVSAVAARERGYGMVVAVRRSTAAIEELEFTRLLLDVAAASHGEQALLSAVYERVKGMPESYALAQSFALVRGRSDLELAGPAQPLHVDTQIDAATEAKEWAATVELRRQRLKTIASPRQRVRELVAIARILQQELGDTEAAIASLEVARALEPRRGSVLQALRRGYETAERWASAIEATGALADVAIMPSDRAQLRYEQALMAVDRLHDDELARTWLEQALEDDPAHAEARAALALLRSSLSVAEPMPMPPEEPEAEIEPAPPTDPQELGDELHPATHLEAFLERRTEGRLDAALLSAMALEELGSATAESRALVQQARSVGPIRARERLDAAAWDLLRPEGMDEVLGALFAAVARPAALARVEQLQARGRLVDLDPAARLDVASTASVVRSFQWAARVLGTPCPELYVVPDVPGDIAAVRAAEPSTAVGPSIASGRSAKDLAFLAGRHLTYYRPEYQVLVFFPTREELTRLILSAVQLTKPDVEPTGEGSRAVIALTSRLEQKINDEERAEVRRAVWELEVRGGKFSTSGWTRNVELMAARAGLFLCGDLATAMGIVSNESRTSGGLPLESRRRDLLGFCVSDEHAALRARFAFTPQSVRPPG